MGLERAYGCSQAQGIHQSYGACGWGSVLRPRCPLLEPWGCQSQASSHEKALFRGFLWGEGEGKVPSLGITKSPLLAAAG